MNWRRLQFSDFLANVTSRISQLVANAFRGVCVIPRWVLGLDLGYEREPGSCISESIALFGLIITESITLAVAEQEAERLRWRSLCIYTAFAVPTLLGYIGILRARPGDGGNAVHAFHQGGIRMARWLFGFSTLGATGIWLLCFTESIPGQSTGATCPVVRYEKHTFGFDDSQGFFAFVDVGVEEFPSGIPPSLNLNVTLDEGFNDLWEVTDAAFVDHEFEELDEENDDFRKPSILDDPGYQSGRSHSMMVLLRELRDDRTYTIRLAFHPRDPDEVTAGFRDDTMPTLDERALITVVATEPKSEP